MSSGAGDEGTRGAPQASSQDNTSEDNAASDTRLDSVLGETVDPLLALLAQAPDAPITRPELRPGDEVAGRFEIKHELGRGGFGCVYLAQDRQLGRPVALKVIGLRRAQRLSAEELHLFDTEAKATARLNHANIVTVHDWGDWQGIPYLVLEYLRGESLAQRLQRGPLPPREAVAIMMEVAQAVIHAHAAGILHLDLKPLNVFVLESGAIKVLDFGLARLDLQRASLRSAPRRAAPYGAAPQTPMTGGTPDYMAPEQWRGYGLGPQTDVWALGVMLFEMIAGARPFTVTGTVSSALAPEPSPSLRKRAPQVPATLDRLVEAALIKDPAARLATATQWLEGLRDLERGWAKEEARRSRRWWVALAVLGGLSLIGFGLRALLRAPDAASAAAVGQQRQLTFEGTADLPEVSPDGKQIAYVAEGSLQVRALSGGQPHQIVRMLGPQFQEPRWSPTGEQLIFWKAGAGASLIPARPGGTPRTLEGTGPLYAWSPDGARIVSAHPDRAVLSITDVSTGASRNIPRPRPSWTLESVDWSSRGRLLVHVAREPDNAIWSLREDGSDAQELLGQRAPLHSPRWSPRADAIYLLRFKGFIADILKLPVDPDTGRATGPPVVRASGLETGDTLAVSRDGQRFVFSRQSFFSNLFRVTVGRAGGAPAEVKPLTHGTRRLLGAHVSPDGSRIAHSLEGSFEAPSAIVSQVFALALEGGAAQPLTFMPTGAYRPVWSTDGKQLAFVSPEGGGGAMRLWRVGAEGGEARVLEATRVSFPYYVAWSPLRRILYQHEGGFRVIDPVTEKETDLVANARQGRMFSPHPSPDGKHVAVFWNREATDRQSGVWLISLADRAQRLIHTGTGVPVGWSSDGQWVYVKALEKESKGAQLNPSGDPSYPGAVDRSEPTLLLRVPISGGKPRTVTRLPFNPTEISMTPDEKRFVCNLFAERRSDIWELENLDTPAP